MVECLPRKYETLSSNPSITKTDKEKNKTKNKGGGREEEKLVNSRKTLSKHKYQYNS